MTKFVPAEFRHDAHHWLILHGRYVCAARKPQCWRCSIARWCEFRPKTASLRIHPGKLYDTEFFARNLTSAASVAREVQLPRFT